MNLLKTERREFLPHHTKALLLSKEKYRKYRKIYIILFIVAGVIFGISIVTPHLITIAAPYSASIFASSNSYENIKVPEFTVNNVSTDEAADILNHPIDTNATQYAYITIKSSVTQKSIKTVDSRVTRLYNYLVSRRSPMSGSVNTFIQVADQYGIDYTLLPAIANTESGLGKVIPKYRGVISYNPFGWGVTGNGSVINFKNWDEAIRAVAKGLVNTFGKENLKPSIMEKTYTPPSYNGDHHWRNNTLVFMEEIKNGL